MRLRDILFGKNAIEYEDSSIRNFKVNGADYRVSDIFNDVAPSAFAAQAFGAGTEYNQIIAKSILDAKELFEKEIPIYVQTEIGDLLKYQGEKNYTSFGEVYEEGESASKMVSKVSTLDILKQVKEDMEKKEVDITNIAYFAHPGHIYRVMEIGRKIGLKGGVFIPKDVAWPENDAQPWVRNPKSWKKREFIARCHHWLLGWVPREI
jgi:hypothetical protein